MRINLARRGKNVALLRAVATAQGGGDRRRAAPTKFQSVTDAKRDPKNVKRVLISVKRDLLHVQRDRVTLAYLRGTVVPARRPGGQESGSINAI